MRILVIGSGAREHALTWKIAQSPRVSLVYVAPGNGGILGEPNCKLVPLHFPQQSKIIDFCHKKKIDLVVVGPEGPLAEGLADLLEEAGILVFGPSKASAQLEASKTFAKRLMETSDIPTARWQSVHKDLLDDGKFLNYLVYQWAPKCVVKEDGLAGGKGVYVCNSPEEIKQALLRARVPRDDIDPEEDHVLLEDLLEGPELSYIVLTDGRSFIPLPPSRDYKRLLPRDLGPNTGGMGAVAPVPISDNLRQNLDNNIVTPILKALEEETGSIYRGFLYVGLMLTAEGPKVLEFNVRGGDPETEAILMALQYDDIVPYLHAAANLQLSEALEYRSDIQMPPYFQGVPTCCVVMASDTYPQSGAAPVAITGVKDAEALPGVKVFHGATKQDTQELRTTGGGRVLAVTARGSTPDLARKQAYKGVRCIRFEGSQSRWDIGLEEFPEDAGASVDE